MTTPTIKRMNSPENALIIDSRDVSDSGLGQADLRQLARLPPYAPSRLLFRLMISTPHSTNDEPAICNSEMLSFKNTYAM